MSEPKVIPKEQVSASSRVEYDMYIPIKWRNTQIYVKHIIRVSEMAELINSVMSACCAGDGGFCQELVDYALRYNIVTTYSLVEMPDDLDEQYRILYCSDLYKVVTENINESQLNSIVETISCYRRGMLQ